MGALLQPPPLLTMAVVLLLTAAALWTGLRRRPASCLDGCAETADTVDRPEAVVTAEQDAMWGTPDPAPPPRTPFSYDRLVAAAPGVDSAEPIAAQPPAEAPEASPEPEMAAPAASQSPLPERPPEHGERTPAQEQEISLADIFTRAQRRREQE
jgi:hypothetical protein